MSASMRHPQQEEEIVRPPTPPHSRHRLHHESSGNSAGSPIDGRSPVITHVGSNSSVSSSDKPSSSYASLPQAVGSAAKDPHATLANVDVQESMMSSPVLGSPKQQNGGSVTSPTSRRLIELVEQPVESDRRKKLSNRQPPVSSPRTHKSPRSADATSAPDSSATSPAYVESSTASRIAEVLDRAARRVQQRQSATLVPNDPHPPPPVLAPIERKPAVIVVAATAPTHTLHDYHKPGAQSSLSTSAVLEDIRTSGSQDRRALTREFFLLSLP